jgi:hypothetical protein
MVIQQNMARKVLLLDYHAITTLTASIQPADHSDFFQFHTETRGVLGHGSRQNIGKEQDREQRS